MQRTSKIAITTASTATVIMVTTSLAAQPADPIRWVLPVLVLVAWAVAIALIAVDLVARRLAAHLDQRVAEVVAEARLRGEGEGYLAVLAGKQQDRNRER